LSFEKKKGIRYAYVGWATLYYEINIGTYVFEPTLSDILLQSEGRNRLVL